MPTRMASFCKEKAVLVTLYVERPRMHHHHHNHHHHHHHHHHLHLHQRSSHRGAGKGDNRRAELLQHARNLRESASSSQPLIPKHNVNVVRSERKAENPKSDPSCVGNWRVLTLSFLRSLGNLRAKKNTREKKLGRNTSKKINADVKRMQGQKKRGLFAMLLSRDYKQK